MHGPRRNANWLDTPTAPGNLSGTLQGAGGVGGLLKSSDGYFTCDAGGNVSEVLSATGTVTAHYEYDAFGNELTGNGATSQNRFQFSTKYHDPETNLTYYGYRYYDAGRGRWLSRDPIAEQGGLNLYAFVANNGVNAWDLFGLCSSDSVSGEFSITSTNGDTFDVSFSYEVSCDGGNPKLEFNSDDVTIDYPLKYNETVEFGVVFVSGAYQYTREVFAPSDPVVSDCENDPSGKTKSWVYRVHVYSGKKFKTGMRLGVGIGPVSIDLGTVYEFEEDFKAGRDNEIKLFTLTFSINHSCCCCND